MTPPISIFLKSSRGRLIVICLLLMCGSWAFLLWTFRSSFSGYFAGQEEKNEIRQDVSKLKKTYQERLNKWQECEKIKKDYQVILTEAWPYSEEQDPEQLLRLMAEKAAKEVEIQLNNLGSVRVSRINQELFYAELDISATAPFEKLVHFLGKVKKFEPRVSWRRLTLFSLPARPQPTTGKTTVTTSSNGTPSQQAQLMMNGTIRVIVYHGERDESPDQEKTPVPEAGVELQNPNSAKPGPVSRDDSKPTSPVPAIPAMPARGPDSPAPSDSMTPPPPPPGSSVPNRPSADNGKASLNQPQPAPDHQGVK